MIYLVAAILVIQTINLVMNAWNSHKINRMNAGVAARQKEGIDAYMSMRKAELEELKHLARESDTMLEIYTDYLREHPEMNKEKPQ